MRWLLGALAGALLGVTLFTGFQLDNLHSQVGQLRSQLGQAQQIAQRSQTGFEGELAAERAAFAQAEARIGGTHRDLITCSDLQVLTWPVTVTGVDAYGNGLNLTGITEQLNMLPSHCINQ